MDVMIVSTSEEFKRRWKACRALLDDDSPLVRNALLAKLRDEPEEGRMFLREITEDSDPLLARHAQDLIKLLGWVDGKSDFIAFIRSQRYELETGWFLLDRTVYPSFELSSATLFLDELGDRCRELLTPPMLSREICSVINRVLFHEYGFRGAVKDFENPDNSFLHRVLERRKGLPITMSILYILVARRLGFDLEPIGLPNRFIVGCFSEERPFYMDPWAGGRFYDFDQMGGFLEEYSIENSGSVLLPVTVADTLVRGCRNLVHHYSLAEDQEKARLFNTFVQEIERIQGIATSA
jgi:regulator of sirC expression with transglutaminase-like and TPR domain